MRLFSEKKLFIASGNQGKIKEIKALLADFPIEIYALGDVDPIVEPEETEPDFRGNAILKAKYYGQKAGMAALADDSGLSVDALNGAPGVYSARWAGKGKDFTVAMDRIETELSACKAVAPFHAHFTCALALYWPDGHVECVEGEVHGTLALPAQGDNGFGYDPIFIPKGHDVTFSQMNPSDKHAISHRAQAFSQLKAGSFAFS
jgi:XTP/dITP diphosphohydrolase